MGNVAYVLARCDDYDFAGGSFSGNAQPNIPAVVVNGGASYRSIAYVQLTDDALSKIRDMRLVSGMPAEVFISTRQRSAASYLVKPFTDQMNRAFRER